jgi:hypothetical protein
VGPKYAVKYHTAAENALSHCYRSCLELLIENGLERYLSACGILWVKIEIFYPFILLFFLFNKWCLVFALCCLKSSHIATFLPFHFLSIAMGCIYTEAKNYPREPAAHVAISEFSYYVCSILYLLYLWFVIQDVLHTKEAFRHPPFNILFPLGGEAMSGRKLKKKNDCTILVLYK